MQPTLYKKDSTGAIRQWKIEVHDSLTGYRMVSGQVGGALVASDWTACATTNAGKRHERGPVAQCEFEVSAAYVKKKKEGYHDSIELATVTEMHFFEPMLAKKYEDYPIKFPIYEQPKLDGIRCLATNDRLHTRKGEPIPSCGHILKALAYLPAGIILDGELYNHDLKDNFNEIASLVRKTKGWEKHQDKIFSVIQYWVYDAFFIDEPELTFGERTERLREVVYPFLDHYIVKLVGTCHVGSQAVLDDLYERALRAGFEGQIIRLNEPYENKRSSALLKRKEFQDEEFTILQIVEGIGNRSGMAGALKLDLGDGRTFQSGIKGGRDHYRYLLAKASEFVGQQATIRYFHRTPDGIPRFPVCVDIGRKD